MQYKVPYFFKLFLFILLYSLLILRCGNENILLQLAYFLTFVAKLISDVV